MAKFELTIVIPTFNEGDIIEASLKRLSEEVGALRQQTEIIIADDGKDDLPTVVLKCCNSLGFASVRVMRNPNPLGKGLSIQNAFHNSEGSVVGFIDVDFSVAPSFIPVAFSKIKEGNDICIASRVGNRFKSDKSILVSICATAFKIIHRNLIFGMGKSFSDTQCGFKFFKQEVAKDLYENLVALDGLTDLEILVKAVKKGYKVTEIKVPRINDREGKRKLSRIIVHESVSLWNIFCKYRLGLKVK